MKSNILFAISPLMPLYESLNTNVVTLQVEYHIRCHRQPHIFILLRTTSNSIVLAHSKHHVGLAKYKVGLSQIILSKRHTIVCTFFLIQDYSFPKP